MATQTFWTARGISSGGGGTGTFFPAGRLPPAFPSSGLSWQPGVTYNGGIPARSTLSPNSPMSPLGTLPVTSISHASPAVLTLASGSLSVGQKFGFSTTGALPTGAFINVTYQVSNVLGGNQYNFTATRTGSATNTTDAGFGTHTLILDDSDAITNEITSVTGTGKVVKLSAATFNIYTSIFLPSSTYSNFTLRGSGAGTGCSGATSLPTDGVGAGGTITGSISGTTLNVTNVFQGGVSVGDTVQTTGGNFVVTADAGGGGGTGNYTLGASGSVSSSTMTVVPPSPSIGGTGTLLRKRERGNGGSGGNTAVDGLFAIGNSYSDAFNNQVALTLDTSLTVSPFTCQIAHANNPGFSAGDYCLITEQTYNPALFGNTPITNYNIEPDVYWWPDVNPNPNYFSIVPNASQQEFKKIASVSINTPVSGTDTITFETPFRYVMKVANGAKINRWTSSGTCVGVGVEDLACFGGMSGAGVGFTRCAMSWVRNVEVYYNTGASFGAACCYRCEVRDSFMNETPGCVPGGASYLMAISTATADSLVENNIMSFGNKVLVMQGSGGGNVISYCYADDSLGKFYATQPESGMNASHWVGSHSELFEGNYSHNFNGDQYWGGAQDIFTFRNWWSGLRAARGVLATYLQPTFNDAYVDMGGVTGRYCCSVGYGHFRNNHVGNILGYSGQTLINYSNGFHTYHETAFNYEFNGSGGSGGGGDLPVGGAGFCGIENENIPPGDQVWMWQAGWDQAITRVSTNQNWFWGPTSYQTHWRTGNWDWVTGRQIWYANIGDTGSTSTGPPLSGMPSSLYIPGGGPPAFWSGTVDNNGNPVTPAGSTFPWVNPYNGSTFTLPSKSRFQTYSGIATIPPGNAHL